MINGPTLFLFLVIFAINIITSYQISSLQKQVKELKELEEK